MLLENAWNLIIHATTMNKLLSSLDSLNLV